MMANDEHASAVADKAGRTAGPGFGSNLNNTRSHALRSPRLGLPLRGLLLLAALPITAAALTGCGGESPQTAARAADPPPQLPLVRGYTCGFEQAREEGRPMLVLFTAPDCVYCREMLDQTLAAPEIVDLSKKFVTIQVDAEEEPEVCRQFRVQAYPTILFMTPQGVPLNRQTGKRSASQLALDMQTALQAVAGRMFQTTTTIYR